jgi:hypothetical protein
MWVSQSDMLYNCIICHTKVPLGAIQEEDEIANRTVVANLVSNLMIGALYAAIFIYVLHYIREIFLVSIIIARVYYTMNPRRNIRVDIPLLARRLHQLW